MNYQDIKTFLTIVSNSSLSKAAEVLFVSQPALSHRLSALEEELGTEFGETEFETLNGYLISKLDKIPDEDEHSQIQADGYLFQIEKVANKMIETVKVQRLPEGTNVVKTQE